MAAHRVVRDLAARLPAMVPPRWLQIRLLPVAMDDVIVALASGIRVLRGVLTWSRLHGLISLEIGGNFFLSKQGCRPGPGRRGRGRRTPHGFTRNRGKRRQTATFSVVKSRLYHVLVTRWTSRQPILPGKA
jgi:hypothetical protein